MYVITRQLVIWHRPVGLSVHLSVCLCVSVYVRLCACCVSMCLSVSVCVFPRFHLHVSTHTCMYISNEEGRSDLPPSEVVVDDDLCQVQFMWQPLTEMRYSKVTLLASFEVGESPFDLHVHVYTCKFI